MQEPTNVQDDQLARDLQNIVHENLGSPEDYTPLMESLTIYIVNRDHMIWNHAYKLGKDQFAKEAIKPKAEVEADNT